MLAFKVKDQTGKEVPVPSQSSSFSTHTPGFRPGHATFKRTRQNTLYTMTQDLVNTYKRCNPAFRVIEVLPQRVLTNPSVPVLNNGMDNEDSNLICKVHDTFQMKDYVFTVLDLLGTGTFGQVFRCMRSDTNEIVAVKVVKNKPAYHSQGLLEIKVARLLNSVHDPNDERHIVRLLDSFEYHGHVCLVFELLSVSLLDVLTQNQFRGLPLVVVQRFTRQILTALVALEEADVIHCDLKPENILLVPSSNSSPNSPANPLLSSPPKRNHSNSSLAEPNSQQSETADGDDTAGAKRPPSGSSNRSSGGGGLSDIKVIDFGSACFEGKTVYSYIQSRFYRSPEVLLGLPYNGAIDMWSLACVCAEMFLGLPLFPGVSQHNQLFRIVEMLGLPPDFLIEGKNGKKYFTVVEKGDSPGGSKDVPIIENSPQSVCVGSAGISAAPAHPSSTCSGAAGAGGSSSSSSSSSAVASGSKFRIKTAEEYAAETNTQVPVLRKYLRYSRLDEVIMRCPLAQKARMTPEQKNVETVRRRCFLDFLQGLFRLNPFERWTARQALSHPFIQNTKFTGPFVPPPDMKINERKLNFMVLTQRKPPPSSFEAPNLSAGVRAPSNFSSHAGMPSGNSAQFTPLQLAHRRMSDPGIDHGGGSGGFQGSKSGGPQLLKRGSPAHLKADAARISPVVEHSPNAVESAVPFSREDSDEMTARSSSDEIPVSRSSEVTPSLQQTAHVTQPVHVQSQPVGVAGKTNVVESAGVGSAESLLTPQMRPENLAAQAIMRAKAREGQVSQLGPQLHAAVQYQQQQQAPTHAQSYQGGGGGGQSQTQRFMQQVAQQQRQRSIFPPQQPNNKPMYEQSLYRHPAQSGSAGNFTLQHPYGPQGETYSQPQLPQMGVSPQNSAAMQMSMSGMPGSSLGASYGNYSTVGSMQDGSSVIMTDFGLALMRPDMDEQRRLLSQTSMQGPYWQQQQPYGSPQNSTYSHPMGGLMGGEPVQRHAVAMSYGYGPNMMQLAAAANAFPYGGSGGGVGHHAGHHPSGQPHQQHPQQQQQQQAGSFDSKTMHARRRNPPAYDHHSAQYPPLQHHMHHAPILAGSPQQHYLAQQDYPDHGANHNQNNVKRLSSRMSAKDSDQRSRNDAAAARHGNHAGIRKPSPSYYKDERQAAAAQLPIPPPLPPSAPSGNIKISADASQTVPSPGPNVIAASYVGTPGRTSFHSLRQQKDSTLQGSSTAHSFLEMEMVRRESFKATSQQQHHQQHHQQQGRRSTDTAATSSTANSRQSSTDSTAAFPAGSNNSSNNSSGGGIAADRADSSSAAATAAVSGQNHTSAHGRARPADGNTGKKNRLSSGGGKEDVLDECEPFFEVDDLVSK